MPQYWLKLQPHCSLLAWTRGLRNNQRARLVVVVEDVAAVIWMGWGVVAVGRVGVLLISDCDEVKL